MTRNQPKFGFVSKRNPTMIKIDIEMHILRFLEAKRIAKRSKKTISAYLQVLEQFRKWYQTKGSPAIDSDVIREYMSYLSFEKTKWDDHPTSPDAAIGLSARTVNNVIRNMKIFFNY